MNKRHYGCIPDQRDFRDRVYLAPHVALPQSVDLRAQCAPIEDQGQLGSCTSFAGGAAIRFARKQQALPDFVTSHLFLYYESRTKTCKTVDSGASIRDMIKAAARCGDCPETEWPYNIDHFDVHPPIQSYRDALKDRAISYQRVARDLTQMQTCLASGFPFVIGISVYSSFESQDVAARGIVPMPLPDEQFLGGHSVLVVGYSNDKKRFYCRNSWGLGWGVNGSGYFEIPYQYLLNGGLASDFWTIRAMTS